MVFFFTTQLTGVLMPQKVVDNINHPAHYNSRSVQCIEFTRHMSFTTGNAFKYLWRVGLKDDATQEWGKTAWYVRDALSFQPFILDHETANCLKMRLSIIVDEFDEKVWAFLVALIDASAGDNALLLKLAIDGEMLTVPAAAILGGEA
jgi:hypothetical protein